MKTYLYAFALAAFLQQATPAAARPISYTGGWTVMQMNDNEESSLHIHYTPHYRYSVGYLGAWMRDERWQFHGGQLNILGKRWNNPASQGNFYIKSGLGVAHSDSAPNSGTVRPAGFTGLSIDWEDRRYFTMYENRLSHAGSIDKTFMQKGRLGIAPYIGDYGDLHTWLMLEVKHTPGAREDVTYTPLVRLFKGDTLIEAGVSTKGEVLFNWTYRF
jgi:hypothetical protein